jgi:hypothetical protein
VRGDLHCHTLYSDGDSWPAEMLGEATARGLDFLGVTDHNGTEHQSDFASVAGDGLPIILAGVEVTTYKGHWSAWVPALGGSFATWMRPPLAAPCKQRPPLGRWSLSITRGGHAATELPGNLQMRAATMQSRSGTVRGSHTMR